MKKTIEDYRVVEQIDGFVIEKRIIIKNTFGRLWWKRTETKEIWNSLNDDGKVVYGSFLNPPTEVKVYESLEEAKRAVENFVNYPIYHYFNQESESEFLFEPKFPIEEPTKTMN